MSGSTRNRLDRSPKKGEVRGGNGGRDWDYCPKSGIVEITVWCADVVDSFVFKHADENSVAITPKKIGGAGGEEKKPITIDWPNEYLTTIKGTIVNFNKHDVVGNLLLITNKGKEYGPYGCLDDGKDFEFQHQNRAIAGFFGRESNFIDAIGVYHQYPPAPIWISQVKIENKMNTDIPRGVLGPWGGNKGTAWDDGHSKGRIKQIDVHVGNDVVHAIDCRYESNHKGCKSSSSSSVLPCKHGGEGASNIHRIVLCNDENLVGISGYYGTAEGIQCVDQVVRSISFYTDLGKHGPFGTQLGTLFNSPACTNAKVVGFHGRSGEYLDSIGVHVIY